MHWTPAEATHGRATAVKFHCAEGKGKGLPRVRGIIRLGVVPAESQKRVVRVVHTGVYNKRVGCDTREKGCNK